MEQLRSAYIPLQPRPVGYPIPLIPLQLQVWNSMRKRRTRLSDWTMYDASVRVLGPLNVHLLQTSIDLVIQRHESLRTRIVAADGMPGQHIDRVDEYQLPTIDLVRSAPSNAEVAVKGLVQEFADTDRDLSIGPLFEAKLVKLSSREHLLLVALDHMFSDAISTRILSRDIWTLYNQVVRGQSPSLPSLPLQFADYSVWQERTYGIWRTEHEAYWRGRLSNAPKIQFPVEGGLRKAEGHGITAVYFSLGETLSAKLRDLARQEGTLLSLVVLAIYVAAAARWCNQRDIVLTFSSHGRHSHSELENMIGLLPQGLTLRIELNKDDTFRDLLKRIIFECRTAQYHQDYNHVREFISDCPADLLFNWVPGNWARLHADKQVGGGGSLEMQPLQLRRSRQSETAMDLGYNLSLLPRETHTGLSLGVAYRDCLFTPSAIEEFSRYFRLLTERFTNCPLTSIATIPLA